jgi:hypothetical protein
LIRESLLGEGGSVAKFETKYGHSDIVYLRVNDEKKRGMVGAINIRPNGTVMYEVGWSGGTSSWHYEIELSDTYVPEWADADSQSGSKQ